MFVRHTLDVAELYVRLRVAERHGRLHLLSFDAEPASWHRASTGVLKPDAFAVVEVGDWEDHVWWEIDRGTESLPTLRRKLLAYVQAADAGDGGPLGVTPRVVVTVTDENRQRHVKALIEVLPPPADRLISVQLFDETFADPPRPPP